MTSLIDLLLQVTCITILAIIIFLLLAVFRFLLHSILGIKP